MQDATPTRTAELLSGVWSFTPEGAQGASPIHVPSHWTHGECLGYPKSWQKVVHAVYERTIGIPRFDPARRCGILFEAVMLGCEVFLDGIRIGGHQGGFTPFEISLAEELWRRLAGKRAVLRIEVDSAKTAFTDNGVIHQVGYPEDGEEGAIPGGVWQNVWLLTRPKLHVVSWKSEYHHATRILAISVEVENSSDADFAGVASIRIGPGRRTLGCELPVRAARGRCVTLSGSIQVADELGEWSTHTPRLHPLSIHLVGKDGKAVDTLKDRIGLREVAISADVLLVNGEPSRLFGISLIRHRVAPYLWHRDYLELYFKTLKSLGFNSLRLHAAIAPSLVLDIADELGLMLINQSSVWSTVVGGYTAGGRSFVENTKREFTEWFARDRNHPSVIAWDVENEQIRIDKASLPWVNELIAHMRTLTPMPICASAAGSLGDDDFIHVHCELNINRMLQGRKFDKPFIAGEWWGPNKEYRETMHAPLKTPDPRSGDHQLSELGAFYRREILAQRVHGAAGTFPFALELLLFRPLFKKNERLAVRSGESDAPFLDRAEAFTKDGNYHVTRRLLVNPGWKSRRPRFKLSPAAGLVRQALAPLVVAPKELNADFYGGTTLRRRFVVCNDTGRPVKAKVSAVLIVGRKRITGVVKPHAVTVPTGCNAEFTVSFAVPRVDSIRQGAIVARLSSASDSAESRTEIRLWPALCRPSPAAPLAVMATDKALRAHLQRLGFSCSETRTIPEKPCVLLARSLPDAQSADDVARFIDTGGRLILLRQECAPRALPIPFKFKAARTLIRRELRGVIENERELSYANRVAITAPWHPIASALPQPMLHPFAVGDHRVVDDAYLRPVESRTEIAGPHTVIMQGMDRSQISLAEVCRGKGVAIVCQLCLAENLGVDPQADAILASMIERAQAYSTPTMTLACDSPRLARWLSETLQVEARMVRRAERIEDADVFVITSSAAAASALRAARMGSSPFRKWLAGGGTCLIALRDATLPGVTIRKLQGDAVIADMTAECPLGWNSSDLDAARGVGVCGSATGAGRRFVERIRVWDRCVDDAYGGLLVGMPLGSLLLERQIGKGRLLVAAVDLKRTDERIVSLLWQTLLSGFGVTMRCAVKRNETRFVARRTVPLPMDGDIVKWTNEEPDVNIAPWTRAVPIAVDERHLCEMEQKHKRPNTHGAVFYILRDDTHLYVAAKLVSDGFEFKGVETFRHERDSIEIRIKDSYVLVSVGGDARPFVHTVGLRDGTQRRVVATARLFDDVSEFSDIGLLALDRAAPLRSVFFEVRIPFDALPYDRSSLTQGGCECGVAFNARTGSPPGRMQCSQPRTMRWNDPATYGTLMFE
jgi:hypothetical protein